MGATNTTANYNLSQFISTDKPAWLQDYNGDMLKIDTAINTAKLAADTAQTTATSAQSDASSAVSSVSSLATTVSSLSTSIGNITGTLNTITSLIGNGTPTTTDHTLIGAINELHADQGDLDDLQTTAKSSLVAAINEAAQSGGGGGTINPVKALTFTTSGTAVGLSESLEDYSYIILTYENSANLVMADTILPISLFKTYGGMRAGIVSVPSGSGSPTDTHVEIAYVDDTHVDTTVVNMGSHIASVILV